MLRIKEYYETCSADDPSQGKIDLKELERFGFVYDDTNGEYFSQERNCDGTTKIKVKSWNRKIEVVIGKYCDTQVLHLLFDLIEAGLVEKQTQKDK